MIRALTVLALALSILASSSGTSAAAAGGSPTHPIEIRVLLTQSHTVAGRPIEGTVILTNTTADRITVGTCAENGWLAIGLRGHVDSLPFARTAVACAPTVRLAPGANRFRVTVITTYAGCTQPEPAGGSRPTLTLPTCTVAGPPPLPAGTYFTTLDVVGLAGLTERPNRVAVTLKAPGNPPLTAPCADRPGRAPAAVTIPDVVGAHPAVAALVLARACLNAVYADPVGTSVATESPAAGATVPEHSTVTLSTR